MTATSHSAIQPALARAADGRFQFGGFVGQRLAANEDEWLLRARAANPAMVEAFTLRDRQPGLHMVPYYGEFVGKFLLSSVLCWRISRSPALRTAIEGLVTDLARVQGPDGYLGPYPAAERLTGSTWDGRNKLWDLWGHYHAMQGLLLWYKEVGDKLALEVCLKAADLLCATFLDTGRRVYDAGFEEMNMALSHGMCLLYEETRCERYLRLVRDIERDWQTPPAGDYYRTALQGVEFYATPKPRWESLHDVQALAELYLISGDQSYRTAFEHIWRSIQRYDRHNTGGFSSSEQAQGNPYAAGAIETCCTVAWIALSIDMLRLTGQSAAADEIELSTFNGMLGAQSPSGRWWTYNTPMDGQRRAFYHDHNFQCLAGSPEMNCCSSNAARGLGMLSDWAVMASADGLALNYYGPSSLTAWTPSGQPVTLTQTSDYPMSGEVVLDVEPRTAERFAVRLRIPRWSVATTAAINGDPVAGVKAGEYLELRRVWQPGDRVTLSLDMTPHYWPGQKECTGLTSLYRGPLLLTYDQRYNTMDGDDVPTLNADGLLGERVPFSAPPEPWLVMRFRGEDGRDVALCDFASAGATGSHYRSWLKVDHVPAERRFWG
jgi:uncharacterized protein